MRQELAGAGYQEALTFALCSVADAFENLRRPEDQSVVKIGNPKTFEFQVPLGACAPLMAHALAYVDTLFHRLPVPTCSQAS